MTTPRPARWPALMDRATAAEYLSTSERQFDGLRDALPAPVYYVGARPRWRRSDLDAWIGNGEAASVNPLIGALKGGPGEVSGRP